MVAHPTLFAQMALKFADHPENIAVEALGHILSPPQWYVLPPPLTPEGRMPKSGSLMRRSESSQQRWLAISHFVAGSIGRPCAT